MRLLFGLLRPLLILAIVLAIPVVAGELVARKLISDAVTSAVRARIGVAPDVSLGASPILLQLIRGRIDTATLRASGARIGGLPPLTLTATLRDVHVTHLTSLQGGIGSLSLEALLAPPAVGELLATPACIGSLPPDLRSALTAAPRVLLFPGRVDLLPPTGRAVEVRLRPAAAGDSVTFRVSGVELGGTPAGSALASARAQANCTRPLAGLPFGVSLVSASARPGTLALAFSGTNATFSALG
jgi:hypothetical protein